jgi:hypothetical protein
VPALITLVNVRQTRLSNAVQACFHAFLAELSATPYRGVGGSHRLKEPLVGKATCGFMSSCQPDTQIRSHKVVVGEPWIDGANAGDFRGLVWGEPLMWIERKRVRQQTLAAQDFVDASDATGEAMRGVQDGGIGVGELFSQRQ